MKECFNERCYIFLKKVPKGKVTTYKEIAKSLQPKAYRAVGNAMNKNPHKDVPCHRVVKSDGDVGGFAKGTKEKIKLLRQEGIEIKKEKVNLIKHLYKY
ncbi:MAG: MGMT family protein [Candidatus Pacearchaeota archaeon]